MKLMEILRENSKYKFDSYDDFMNYIKDRVQELGQKYYTSSEYRDIYPIGQQLHKMVKAKHIEKKSKELIDNDVKVGDKIEITWNTMFGGNDSVVGTLFFKDKIPYVKLPYKMSVSVKGKIVQKQSVPYSSKSMRKV